VTRCSSEEISLHQRHFTGVQNSSSG
jgi:hypothetical protein